MQSDPIWYYKTCDCLGGVPYCNNNESDLPRMLLLSSCTNCNIPSPAPQQGDVPLRILYNLRNPDDGSNWHCLSKETVADCRVKKAKHFMTFQTTNEKKYFASSYKRKGVSPQGDHMSRPFDWFANVLPSFWHSRQNLSTVLWFQIT
jgi:hypothetical protein